MGKTVGITRFLDNVRKQYKIKGLIITLNHE